MRCLTVLILLAFPFIGLAAEPPSQAILDRLGLQIDWVGAVPLTGESDGIATVQIADARQIFVQTKGGLLVAFDAATGERLWMFRYDNAVSTPFAVGWNDRYVFAFSVVRMYGIQRLTGILDFSITLPLSPTAPPAADANHVYVVLGGNRIAAYELPAALAMPDPKLVKAANQMNPGSSAQIRGLQNPADVVSSRYPAATRNLNPPIEQPERRSIRLTTDYAGTLNGSSRLASLAVVGSLKPPYRAFDEDGRYLNESPSLSSVGSLRQPYHLLDPTAKNAQRTPSIASIPPSLAALHESINLRPRGIELRMRWIHGSVVPIIYAPLQTRNRLWGLSNSPIIVALKRDTGDVQIDATLSASPTAQACQAEDVGYVPQTDGYLAAIDLDGGAARTARIIWKANVGGMMNRPPVPTANAIYQAGSNAGIARIDRATGEVVWRTANVSDRLLALNDEHVYATDSHGRIYVYDRNMVSDAATKRAWPLATADLPAFSVPITNPQTDRIYLASDRGLFVCLRDAAPKYAVAQTIAPPKMLPPPKPAAMPGN